MLAAEIKRRALQLGYLACGIIPANSFDAYTADLDIRMESFPESSALYESFYDFTQQAEQAKSIIVCTRRYNNYKLPESLDGLIGKLYLFHCKVPYAQAYRETLEFEAYLSTLGLQLLPGNVPVRLAAAYAGLGKFGYNNFIYDPDHGSYIWIDAWIVGQELEYDTLQERALLPACGDTCRKCIQACPTNALSNSLLMDRGKCLTHLLTHVQDVPDEDTMSQMGLWLYGCDRCQDVCPMNQGKFVEREEFPLLAEYETCLNLERILEMDEDTYQNIIRPRFHYSGKSSLWRWKCNALRHMINTGDERYHARIRACRTHVDPRVRKVAEWGCNKLEL